MQLASWLQYIESLHPREIELGLERVAEVAGKLSLDLSGQQVITVAGTNGKGSCVAALEALLLQQGLRVGAYTSPHLQRYNERVRISGQEIGDDALCDAFTRIEDRRDSTPLTYFEFGTLAALLAFQEANLEVVILEVGLGGRLDAVNIIDSDVAIITSIDLDHTDWLGDSREAIGYEKAGILRAGKPLVCADRQPPRSVLELAAAASAPVFLVGQEFEQQRNLDGTWQWWGTDANGRRVTHDSLPVPGLYADPVAAALEALCLLGRLPDHETLGVVLASLSLPGRFELRRDAARSCTVVLDVAHNPAAAKVLAGKLTELKQRLPGQGRVILILAIMQDKDVTGFVQALDSVVDIWYIAQVNQVRCMPAQKLAGQMETLIGSKPLAVFDTVQAAYQQACKTARPEDLIVVTGSFYTVAEVSGLLDN